MDTHRPSVFKLDLPEHFSFPVALRDTTRKPFGLLETVVGDWYHTVVKGTLVAVDINTGRTVIPKHPEHKADVESIRLQLRHRLGFEQDLAAFYRHMALVPKFQPLLESLRGLRILQKDSPFEALVNAIADQQLNVSFAARTKARLVRMYGDRFTHQQTMLYAFPTPETLAQLDEQALRPLQFSTNKSRFIVRLARGVVDGSIPLEEWNRGPDEELLDRLKTIYGVGSWTAEYAAMIGYQRLDTLPAADIGLLNALQKLYGLPVRPTAQEARKLTSSWKPFRGLATYYLWHALEQGIL